MTTRKLALLQDFILIAAANVSAYYIVRYALSRVQSAEDKEEFKSKNAAAAVLRRLDIREQDEESISDDGRTRRRKEDLVLNEYERTVALGVIAPEDIPVKFEDIGGLEDIIEELRESVIYPLTMPHLYSDTSSLLSAPSGVLLHGPPGCGKTMLAKALAHEGSATFINVHISTLTNKWYGDSNKLVNAVFSLAAKLEPAIVFIDEIDAVLGTRRSGEHEASNMAKAEFMTLWDGLTSVDTSGKSQRIVVLGATNRLQDIDEAILRRMPKKFEVSLPNASQRLRILGLVLRDTRIDKANFDFEYLVRVMAGMSGSDIKEACRDAAMVPVREFIKRKRTLGKLVGPVNPDEVRGLQTGDFFGSAGGAQLDSKPLHSMMSSEVSEESDEAESTD